MSTCKSLINLSEQSVGANMMRVEQTESSGLNIIIWEQNLRLTLDQKSVKEPVYINV